jgi:hypothetical protein
MSPHSKKEVSNLGEERENHHFVLGIWDKEDKHPTAACFRLSKNRVLLAYEFHLLVRDFPNATDAELLNIVK